MDPATLGQADNVVATGKWESQIVDQNAFENWVEILQQQTWEYNHGPVDGRRILPNCQFNLSSHLLLL